MLFNKTFEKISDLELFYAYKLIENTIKKIVKFLLLEMVVQPQFLITLFVTFLKMLNFLQN